MDWVAVTVLGACGGALVQLIDLAVAVKEWRKARHEALIKGRTLPKLALYIDVPADSLVFLTRLALGTAAAFIFHAQIVGPTAAVAVGASAPALLRQLGAFRSAEELTHGGLLLEAGASREKADAASVSAEEG